MCSAALYSPNPAIFRSLLLAGGDPNEVATEERMSVLMTFAQEVGTGDGLDGARVECVRLLLAAGADTELADATGRTALRYMCALGDRTLPVVAALLAGGADPDAAPGPLRGRCIDAAVAINVPGRERECLGIVRALIAAGADVSPAPMTTNDDAAARGAVTSTYMQTLCRADAADSPAEAAARKVRSAALLEVLLAAGADPAAVACEHNAHEHLEPPLVLAIKNGFARGVDLLLAAGASPDVLSPAGARPLLLAQLPTPELVDCSAAILRSLLGAGASIALADVPRGDLVCNALLSADGADGADRVSALLAAGADPNIASPTCSLTPFEHALMCGEPRVIAAVLDAGAAPRTSSAVPSCDVPQCPGTHYFMLALGSDRCAAGLAALLLSRPETAAAARAEVAARCCGGLAPLSAAARKGHGAAVLELLAAGADAGAADARGVTSLAELRGATGKGRNRGEPRRGAFKAALAELQRRAAATGGGGGGGGGGVSATDGTLPRALANDSDGELNAPSDFFAWASAAAESARGAGGPGGGAPCRDRVDAPAARRVARERLTRVGLGD